MSERPQNGRVQKEIYRVATTKMPCIYVFLNPMWENCRAAGVYVCGREYTDKCVHKDYKHGGD